MVRPRGSKASRCRSSRDLPSNEARTGSRRTRAACAGGREVPRAGGGHGGRRRGAGQVPERRRPRRRDLDDLDVVDAVGSARRAAAPQRVCSSGSRGWPSCRARHAPARNAAASSSAVVAVEDLAAGQTAGTSRTPRSPRRAVASSSAARTERSVRALRSARGCISHAAAGDEDVVRPSLEVAAAGVGLAERRERERDGCGRLLGVRRRAHRERAVERERLAASAPAAARARRPRARSARSAMSRSSAQRKPSSGRRRAGRARAPGSTRTAPARAAGCARPRGTPPGCEVEVEAPGARSTAQPWMSQPSAARAASMTASDSVGWPWTMRATSG